MTDPAITLAEAFDLAQLPAGAREAVRVLDGGGVLRRVTGGWRPRNGKRFSGDTVAVLQRFGLVERATGAAPRLVLTELGRAIGARLSRGTRA